MRGSRSSSSSEDDTESSFLSDDVSVCGVSGARYLL